MIVVSSYAERNVFGRWSSARSTSWRNRRRRSRRRPISTDPREGARRPASCARERVRTAAPPPGRARANRPRSPPPIVRLRLAPAQSAQRSRRCRTWRRERGRDRQLDGRAVRAPRIFGKIPGTRPAGLRRWLNTCRTSSPHVRRATRSQGLRAHEQELQDGDRVGRTRASSARDASAWSSSGAGRSSSSPRRSPTTSIPARIASSKSGGRDGGKRAQWAFSPAWATTAWEGARRRSATRGIVVAESQDRRRVRHAGHRQCARISQKVLPLPPIAEYLASLT